MPVTSRSAPIHSTKILRRFSYSYIVSYLIIHQFFTSSTVQSARAAAVNAEQFARTDGAIPLLLGLLEGRGGGNPDTLHIRFQILQIMHSLLDANTLFAQQVGSFILLIVFKICCNYVILLLSSCFRLFFESQLV